MGIGRAVPERVIGRYALFDRIAEGGMATVHLGRMMGPAGWSRVVAIKRMRKSFASDRDFVRMFLEEARLTTRVRHPNVVSATDVVAEAGELFLVMDYVEGESLARLIRGVGRGAVSVPIPVAVSIVVQALHGLHAAHEAKSESGDPLGLVHRDVSPENILVGTDGLARVVDFGIAKARGGEQTRGGVLKGKAAYMAPEQIRAEKIDRRVDVYAASVVLWEALTGHRLFVAETAQKVFDKVLSRDARPLASTKSPDVSRELDAIVAKGMHPSPDERYATALEMAEALEEAVVAASPRTVSKWVDSLAHAELEERAARVAACEAVSAALPTGDGGEGGDFDDTFEESGDATDVDRPAPALAPIAPRPSDDDPPPIEETKPVLRAPVAPPPALDPTEAAPVRSRAEMAAGDVEEPRAAPAPSRAPQIAIAVGVAVFASAVGALVLVRACSTPRGARTVETPTAATTVVVPRPPPTSSAIDSAPIATASSPALDASAPIEEPALPSAAVSSSAKPSASIGRPPSRARCTPPFYYEGGFKRFKPGCL